MAPISKVPRELTRGPFTLVEARAAGLTRHSVRGKQWLRLGRELYCWVGWQRDHWQILRTWHRVHSDLAFSGLTAAWMHGLDCDPTSPTQAIAPINSSLRTCEGLHIRRCARPANEVVSVRGLAATSFHRTLRELSVQLPDAESLVFVDMALRLALTDRIKMARYVQECAGLPGSRMLRHFMELAEPAESPMETRLRWLLHRSGLPRPHVQTQLLDADGRFLGRADLYYPTARLAIEFDGGSHRDRLVADDRRQNLLLGAGYRLLRFTSADLRDRPNAVVLQVRGALTATSVA